MNCQATGDFSHVEGYNSKSIGGNSHAEGYGTESKGLHSHAEGFDTKAYSNYSHAEGVRNETWPEKYNDNNVSNVGQHAEGIDNKVTGRAAHVGGEKCDLTSGNASPDRSFVHGYYLTCSTSDQVVFGKYNANNSDASFIIGGGTSDTNRKNIFEVHNKGNVVVGSKNTLDVNKTIENSIVCGSNLFCNQSNQAIFGKYNTNTYENSRFIVGGGYVGKRSDTGAQVIVYNNAFEVLSDGSIIVPVFSNKDLNSLTLNTFAKIQIYEDSNGQLKMSMKKIELKS
jgi:hypothetical protein